MLSQFFETKKRAHRDAIEIQNLATSYGAGLLPELKRRAEDSGLNARDRKHWERLLKKAHQSDLNFGDYMKA